MSAIPCDLRPALRLLAKYDAFSPADLLGLVAVFASYTPARRGLKINPVGASRADSFLC